MKPRHAAIAFAWVCWAWALYEWSLWSLLPVALGLLVYLAANAAES